MYFWSINVAMVSFFQNQKKTLIWLTLSSNPHNLSEVIVKGKVADAPNIFAFPFGAITL